jgi:hypothetical protein
MGVAVNSLVRLNLWLAILGGAVVYAILVFLLRILDREELSSIQRMLAMRRGAQAEAQGADPGSVS